MLCALHQYVPLCVLALNTIVSDTEEEQAFEAHDVYFLLIVFDTFDPVVIFIV